MKKAIGYSLFVLSCITWGGVATIPYWDVSMGVAAAYTTGLLIIGEIAFFLSMVLPGKEFLMKIKNFWVKLKFFFRSKGIRKLTQMVNKLKIETSISLRMRDEEVEIHGKSNCWDIGRR